MDDKKDETLAIVPQQETASAHVPIAIGRISSKCFTFDAKTKINSATIYVNATKETILASLLDEASFRSVFHPYKAILANVQGDEIEYKVQGYTRRSFYRELNSFKFTVKEYEVQIQVLLPEKTHYNSFLEDNGLISIFLCCLWRKKHTPDGYIFEKLEAYFDSYQSKEFENAVEAVTLAREARLISKLVFLCGLSVIFSALSCITNSTILVYPIDFVLCLSLFIFAKCSTKEKKSTQIVSCCCEQKRSISVIYGLSIACIVFQILATFGRQVVCDLGLGISPFGILSCITSWIFGMINIVILCLIVSSSADFQEFQCLFRYPVLYNRLEPGAHYPPTCYIPKTGLRFLICLGILGFVGYIALYITLYSSNNDYY